MRSRKAGLCTDLSPAFGLEEAILSINNAQVWLEVQWLIHSKSIGKLISQACFESN